MTLGEIIKHITTYRDGTFTLYDTFQEDIDSMLEDLYWDGLTHDQAYTMAHNVLVYLAWTGKYSDSENLITNFIDKMIVDMLMDHDINSKGGLLSNTKDFFDFVRKRMFDLDFETTNDRKIYVKKKILQALDDGKEDKTPC